MDGGTRAREEGGRETPLRRDREQDWSWRARRLCHSNKVPPTLCVIMNGSTCTVNQVVSVRQQGTVIMLWNEGP